MISTNMATYALFLLNSAPSYKSIGAVKSEITGPMMTEELLV